MNNSSNVFVITRFGLGQACEEFYNLNLKYLTDVLFKSLQGQTFQNFQWVLLVDKNAPLHVKNHLRSLNKKMPQMKIHYHSPLEHCKMLPDLGKILETLKKKENQYCIMLRIDSDDGLAKDGLQKIIQKLLAQPKNIESICLNPTEGVYFYSEKSRWFLMRKSNYSVIALRTKFGSKFMLNIHSHGHQKMLAIHFKNKKMKLIEYSSDNPIWMRTIRAESDSRSGKRVRLLETNFLVFRKIRYFILRCLGINKSTKLIRELSAPEVSNIFGLNEREFLNLKNVEQSSKLPPVLDILGRETDEKRLPSKAAILDELYRLRQLKNKSATQLMRINQLKKIFYQF